MKTVTITNKSKAHRGIGTEKFHLNITLAPGQSVDIEASRWAKLKENNAALKGHIADGTLYESAEKDASAEQEKAIKKAQADAEASAEAAAKAAKNRAASEAQKAAKRAQEAEDAVEAVKAAKPEPTKPEPKK